MWNAECFIRVHQHLNMLPKMLQKKTFNASGKYVADN